MTLLKVEGIHTYIDQFHILQGVSFTVKKDQVTVLLGRNGAGKTTTLRSIMGLIPISSGNVAFQERPIDGLPAYRVARQGIGYVPEDQAVFGDLTVEENLKVAVLKDTPTTRQRQEWLLDLFPDLKTFWHKKAGHLSGGQKRMLAIARACVNPNQLLLIDEPSKGLAPVVVDRLMTAIASIKKETTIVLVEQNFYMAGGIGDSYFILDDGMTVHQGNMLDLKKDEELKRKYLGIA